MAIDINAFGLPVVPSAETGLYELPDEQAERIAVYVKAMLDAKGAGVLGQEVRYPGPYVNKVVAQRVADARTGGIVWTDRCAEMAREQSAWLTRSADHASRAIKREMTASGLTRDEAALELAARADALDEATLERLVNRHFEVIGEDQRRTSACTGSRIDPTKASVYARTLRRLARTPVFDRAGRLFRDMREGVWDAAVAMSVWDELSIPERAIMYGPWAEVVDGDLSILEGAWTDQADRLRREWQTLPREAFDWPPDPNLF